MILNRFLFILLLILSITNASAGGSNLEKNIHYFFQIGSGYSHTQTTPNLKLQSGLNISKAPIRWGYRLGFGALTNAINNNIYGLEVALAQYSKNKWLFAPLSSSIVQNLNGVEVIASIRRNLNSKSMLAFKAGGVFLRQSIKATGTLSNPTRFSFEYLGTSTKLKPLLSLELNHELTKQTSVFLTYSYIFGSKPIDANTLGGAAPSPIINASWSSSPGIHNLIAGLIYHFN